MPSSLAPNCILNFTLPGSCGSMLDRSIRDESGGQGVHRPTLNKPFDLACCFYDWNAGYQSEDYKKVIRQNGIFVLRIVVCIPFRCSQGLQMGQMLSSQRSLVALSPQPLPPAHQRKGARSEIHLFHVSIEYIISIKYRIRFQRVAIAVPRARRRRATAEAPTRR